VQSSFIKLNDIQMQVEILPVAMYDVTSHGVISQNSHLNGNKRERLKPRKFLIQQCLNFGAGIIFFNFSTYCIQNVNNTGTKYVRIMKQTAF